MGNLLGGIGATKDGKVTNLGWDIFSDLLDLVRPVPDLPLEIFFKFMSKVVSTSVELVFIRQGKVFLTWRDDKFFLGWHFPGGYIAPGETFLETAQRVVKRELTAGVKITEVKMIGAVNHPESHRFHEISIILLAEFEGQFPAKSGKWFGEKPKELIDYHQDVWTAAQPFLS